MVYRGCIEGIEGIQRVCRVYRRCVEGIYGVYTGCIYMRYIEGM